MTFRMCIFLSDRLRDELSFRVYQTSPGHVLLLKASWSLSESLICVEGTKLWVVWLIRLFVGLCCSCRCLFSRMDVYWSAGCEQSDGGHCWPQQASILEEAVENIRLLGPFFFQMLLFFRLSGGLKAAQFGCLFPFLWSIDPTRFPSSPVSSDGFCERMPQQQTVSKWLLLLFVFTT